MAESQPSKFSLDQLQLVDRRGKSFLYLLLAGIIALSAEAVLLAIPRVAALEQRGLSTATGQAFEFVLLETIVIVAIAALTIPAYLTGARSVEVDDHGIRIDYGGLNSRELLWDDTHARFALIDYSEYSRMLHQSRGYHLYVPYVPGLWSFNRRSLLTRDAFQAILVKATEKEVSVTTIRGNALWYGRSPLIHRIRGSTADRRV